MKTASGSWLIPAERETVYGPDIILVELDAPRGSTGDLAPIRLRCRHCGKAMDYERSIDPTIPASVVVIEQGHCDDCWDGDRDDEIWFDAQGREVPQTNDED